MDACHASRNNLGEHWEQRSILIFTSSESIHGYFVGNVAPINRESLSPVKTALLCSLVLDLNERGVCPI